MKIELQRSTKNFKTNKITQPQTLVCLLLGLSSFLEYMKYFIIFCITAALFGGKKDIFQSALETQQKKLTLDLLHLVKIIPLLEQDVQQELNKTSEKYLNIKHYIETLVKAEKQSVAIKKYIGAKALRKHFKQQLTHIQNMLNKITY